MSYANGVVSKPIETLDIAQALGISSRDVGTLCSSPNIKWWSKEKPFQYSAVAFNEDDGVSSITRVEARKSVNQGFSLGNVYGSASNVLDAAISLGVNTLAWTYNRPTSYYRMLDFDGYDHTKDNISNCPFKYRPEQSQIYDTDTVSFNSVLEANWNTSDFATLDGWYIGCAFRLRGSGLAPTWFTFNNGTEIPTTHFITTGTYEFCIFFCNVSKTITEVDKGASFYLTPIPYAGEVQKYSGIGVSVSNSGTLNFDTPTRKNISNVTLKGLGKGRYLTDVQFVYRTSASRVWSSADSGEGDGPSYATLDVPMDGVTFETVNISGTSMLSGKYYVRFRLNGVQKYLNFAPKESIQPLA